MATITIGGVPVPATRIDELNQTLLHSRDHVVPAMHDGMTVRLTIAQVLSLLKKEDLPFDPDDKLDLAGGTMLGDLDMDGHNILNSDAWAFQPIVVPIPLLDNLVGVAAPPTDKDYRYIKLTASDVYNTGVLTGESVTGSAPLVIATAVIDLPASPLDGETIHLINTERRFLRAGAPGSLENDQMQQITGNLTVLDSDSGSSGGAIISRTVLNAVGIRSAAAPGPASPSIRYNLDSSGSPSARTGDETRSKNIGVTYFMRVL